MTPKDILIMAKPIILTQLQNIKKSVTPAKAGVQKFFKTGFPLPRE